MGEFMTWANLGTYAGAVLATTLITQFVKQIPYVEKVNPQIVSYIIAVVLLLGAAYFNGQFTVDSAVLCFVNAVITALAANGVYDAATFKKQIIEEYVHEEV